MEPMFSEHISGCSCNGYASRSSSVMRVLPPVVMLMTASVCSRIRGTIMSKTAGSGVGRPSCGSRACRCTMAAPALAASTAFCTKHFAEGAAQCGRHAAERGVHQHFRPADAHEVGQDAGGAHT